jgi:ketosteroid isomerase-like protein
MTRTVDQVEQLVRGYIKAFNARDFDALMSIYAADATLEDPVATSLSRFERRPDDHPNYR